MHPQIHVGVAALAVAVLASFSFGFVWHGPLFGKLWARLMKVRMDPSPGPGGMAWRLALTLGGTLLTAHVLGSVTEVWRPSVWNAGGDAPAYVYGFLGGFFTWIGFYVPPLLGMVTWEGKPWGLFVLSACYRFLDLQIMALILAYGR